MIPRRIPYWLALCLVFFLAAQVLLAQESFELHLPPQLLKGAEAKYGPDASKRLRAWAKLIADNRKKPEMEKLKLVNEFFNQVNFVSDQEHWGVKDYWATPVEMLASNGGDCEDYSIAKYFTLLALGFNMDKLRITYVKAVSRPPNDQAHMVLTYYPQPDAMPFVLDNLDGEIKPADERGDLIPVYSFNGDGLWLAKERSSGRSAGSSSRISLWTEMNARMGKEFSN